MKKFEVIIKNNETKEVNTLDLEGFVLLGVVEREEGGMHAAQAIMGVNSKDMANLIVGLEQEFPDVRKAKMLGMIEGLAHKLAGDACDCPKCTEKREAEAATNQSEG